MGTFSVLRPRFPGSALLHKAVSQRDFGAVFHTLDHIWISALLKLRKNEATLRLSSIINVAVFMGATKKTDFNSMQEWKRERADPEVFPGAGFVLTSPCLP